MARGFRISGGSGVATGSTAAGSRAAALSMARMLQAKMEAQGHELAAQSLLQASKGVEAVSALNIAVQRQNTHRQLENINAQARKALSTQQSAVAKSNVSLASKSALQVQSEAITDFTRASTDMQMSAANQRNKTYYESEVQRVNLINQARMEKFKGSAALAMGMNQAVTMLGS